MEYYEEIKDKWFKKITNFIAVFAFDGPLKPK